MNLIIEISNIKNCIEQLRTLARQYESYTDVFAPSNFSVPSGTPLSRKLTDVRNNYRGIQINLQLVAQYLEYYVTDLENVENKMGNLGTVSSFHSNLSLGSISETSGLVEKPYSFPKTRIFDGASNVTFAETSLTENVQYQSLEDMNKIMNGDELLKTKETQALMQKYHLNNNQALYILHKARGLQLGETKANGKPFLAPEVLKEEDIIFTPLEAGFYNNYMSLANSYQLDSLKAIQKNSESSLKEIKDIERTLKGYNFTSLDHYQSQVQLKYNSAKAEAKIEVNNFRTKQEWASRIGLSLNQVAKMSDEELIESIVQKDQLIGSDYKKILAIGEKVGFSEKDQRRLYKLQSDYNAATLAIFQIEENEKVQPYHEVLNSERFKNFDYQIKKTTVKTEFFDDKGDSINYATYKNELDPYSFVKNCKEQYRNIDNAHILGVTQMEAISDLQSIAELYPEYEKEYYYYLNTKGQEGAKQYLKDMQSTFARLSGEYKASKRLEYLRALPENEREKEFGDYLNSAGLVTSNAFVSSVYGVGDGATGWFENIGHIGDQKRYLSSHEWEKNYFRTAISSEKSRTEGKYLINENGLKSSSSNLIDFTKNYGTPVGFTYDVGQGVGNMLPTMVASSVFAPAGVASRVVGGVTMGAGIYGGTYHDYMVQGYDESTAHKAAALSAIAETATEELYGGFSFLNGGPVYNFKTGFINALKEGGQEVFQDANDPIIRAIVTGEKIDLSKINVPDLLKKEAYTFVVGGATAGAMNLPGQVSSSHSIKVNQSNLNLLGNYYNNGNITMDQLHDLVSSTLGISELENSDIASILKFNKNGLSTISKTANGTINPDLVLALGEMSAANNIVVQQRDLVKNTPALAPYVSNISQNENAVVPDGIKDAYTKYKSLEEKLNSYGEEIKNSAKQFQLKDDSVMGLNKRMQDLKSQHVGLEELLEKYDAGEKVHVSKNLSEAFNEYLTLRSKEGIINQQLEEIATNRNTTGALEQFGKVKSYLSDVVSSYLSGALESQTVGIVPPVVRDFMQSPISHPIESIKNLVNQYYNQHNLSFFDRINFVNNQTDSTTVGELKQGIIEAIPSGLSKMEQARFAYLALSQQLGFDENLQSNPKEGAFEATRDFYQNITDDTVLNRKTVCISWARIYSDILTSLGIDNKYQAKGHAWVEFDADGILIKADATDGNVMDLTNVSLGLETQKFSPINQYSDPLNGIISSPFYSSKEAYDSFYAALKQIDKNIGYIQDEYNTINKKAIIADTDTTLTEKLKLFSSNYLDGLDFEGAKSLLLNFVSSLNNSGEYEISGTDMIKIRNDGKADIINITSILDENGQYRYFALHENMGLTEITARDLDVLQSNGYLLDNAKKLVGYQYNSVTGTVNSLINKMVSKVATIVNPNLLEHTESVLSNDVTTLLTQNNNIVNQSVNNETQSIVIDIAPLSFSKFNALSVSDMIQYIQNNFTVDSSEIINLFDMWDTLDPKICEAIRTKMIQDQNYIFSSKYLTILGRDLSKVVNSDMLEQLSDLSLCRLLATSDLNHLDADMILQEIVRRLDNGDLVVDQYLFQQTKNEGGFELDEVNNFGSKITNEVGKKISALANASVTEEIKELSAKYRNDEINLNQLLLLRRVLKEDHSPIVIEILDDLIQANPKNMKTFNFELLNPNIINYLGKDFIESIGNYQNMSNFVMDIYKSDPELLAVYAKGLSYLNQFSDTIFKNCASTLLNFLHSNAQYFRNENLDAFSSEDIINYALSYSLFENNLKLDSRGFKYSLNQYCDSLLDSAVLISDLQDVYLLKTYSMNRDTAEKFLSTYSESLNDLPGLDHSILDMVDDIKSVLNMNSDSFDLLKEKIQNSHSVTPIEVEEVKFKIRDKVFAQFEEDFKKTNDVYGSLKGFQEVQVDGLFSLLVKSTNSGIAGTDSDVSKGYVDYFKSPNPKSHLLAGSYINNNCLYTAGENGVLFGWSNMSKDDMKLMGVKDIKSDILSYGYTSTRDQKYVTPASMTQLTNSEYNELDTINKMPQYVVVKADASDIVRQNSLNAAKELDIPVLYLPDANASNLNLNDSSVHSASTLDDSAVGILSQQFDSSLSEAVRLTSLQRLMNMGQQIRYYVSTPEFKHSVLNQANTYFNSPTLFTHPLETTVASVVVNPVISNLIIPFFQKKVIPTVKRVLNDLQQIAKNPTFQQYVLNKGNIVLNTPTFFSNPLQTTIVSVANPVISKFMFNSNVVNNLEMSNKILNEGLYHFVTRPDSMPKILDSHKFKASWLGEGYINTSFFFAGIPSFEEACYHLNKGNNPVDKIQGFRLNVDPSKLSEYQYRAGHDGVVMHLGDVVFNDEDITPVYLVAKEEQGIIRYVEVSKEDYDNYQSEISSDNTDQLIRGMISEFSQNVDNVERFNRVFKDFKIGLTNGQVVNSFVSNLLNLLNIIPGVKVDLPINQSMNETNKIIDLQNRLETLKKENPGIEEEYIRIEKEMNLEHAVRLTPEMVEYRFIMHQLGLDKNNNVNNQQVETLPIEDDTFTIDDIKSTYLDVSLYNNKYFTVTLVDPKSIYAIIFDSDVYHNFMDFNNHRNEFGDISYPLYLKAIEKFISIELDGRNFGSEISQRIYSLLELVNHSNDYLCPVKTYNIDETATSYQVKKNRLEALINQYPSLLTNKNGVPLEVIKEANLLQDALRGSKYASLIVDSVPCLELSSASIQGESLPIPVELIEQILTDEKTYQAFQNFEQSRFIFGNVSARDYYRAIMLYYLDAKKSGKPIKDFKNLDGLLNNMNQYLNSFEISVVQNDGSPVLLNARLNGEMKEFLEYLNLKSIIVSGENRYTVEQVKNILNNNSGIVPDSFFEGLHSIDMKPFAVEIDVTQEIPTILWLESVLNDQNVFDNLMNDFDFKAISSKIEGLQKYIEQKGDSITTQELNRYHIISDKYEQVRDVISYIQNNIFKHPELYSYIKNYLESKSDASSVEIGQKIFNKDSVQKALDLMSDGLHNYQMVCQAFQDFASIFFTGKSSDRTSLQNVYNAFVDAYNKRNEHLSLAYLNKLRSIKAYIPEFCFLSNTITRAFFDGGNNYIELGKNSQSSETIYHEITHAFDCYYSNYDVSNEWNSMIKKTKKFLLRNKTYKQFCLDASNAYYKAKNYADSVMEERFHKTKQQILKDLENQYENKSNVKELFLNKMNQQYGLNENDRRATISDFSPKNLAVMEYELMSGIVYDDYMRAYYPVITAVSDMLDGVFSGNQKELNKHRIFTPYSHGEKYYGKFKNANAIEAIADFGALAFLDDGIIYLKRIFGDEYFDMLNQKYHNIVWR